MPRQNLCVILFISSNLFLCVSVQSLNFEKRSTDHVDSNDRSDSKNHQGYLVEDGNVWKCTLSNTKDEDIFSVFIQSNSSQHSCDTKFLSLTIDSGEVRWKFEGFSFGSKQLQTLARGLSPCYLRLGGTSADFLTFDPDERSTHGPDDSTGRHAAFAYDHVPSYPEHGNLKDLVNFTFPEHGNLKDSVNFTLPEHGNLKDLVNFTLPGSLWKKMTHFFQDVGWDLIFDFNLFKWQDGYWDPSNARLLLNFSDAMGYDIAGFQLGNEPNAFNHKFNFSIDPPVLVKNFGILKNLISQFPRYRKSPLFGPDVTDLFRHSSSRTYLEGFLQAGGGDVVSEISLHQYYMDGRTATVEDFYNLTVLNALNWEIDIALQTTQALPKPLPIRFTETSSCYGGGAPGLSDAYVAGFLWLDKLGLSANYGVTKVFRQTFFGGHYSLLSEDAQPNPDYFLSLLHKRLILGPVFNVTVCPANKRLRIYAHCARTDFYNFPQGSLTLAFLNVAKQDHTISLYRYPGQTFYLYSLTPGDDNGLKSKYVKLNGDLLKMKGDELPRLEPRERQGNITLPALTFGFIVIPQANVSLCRQQTSE